MKSEKTILNEISNLVEMNFLNKGKYKYFAHILSEMMLDNEEIKIICLGKCNDKQQEVFCTNKRIFVLNNSIMPQTKVINIEKIDSLQIENKGLFRRLHIVYGGTEFIIDNLTESQKFISTVNEQQDNYKSFKVEINKTVEKDILDKIEKLAELYKDGVLTEYEFSTKKMELLEQLKKGG